MTFRSFIDTQWDALAARTEAFEEISYTPYGGDATTINAVIDRSGPAQETYVRGSITATCTITVFISEVSSPARGDRYTFHSETWEMDPDGVIQRIEDQFYEIALRRID